MFRLLKPLIKESEITLRAEADEQIIEAGFDWRPKGEQQWSSQVSNPEHLPRMTVDISPLANAIEYRATGHDGTQEHFSSIRTLNIDWFKVRTLLPKVGYGMVSLRGQIVKSHTPREGYFMYRIKGEEWLQTEPRFIEGEPPQSFYENVYLRDILDEYDISAIHPDTEFEYKAIMYAVGAA